MKFGVCLGGMGPKIEQLEILHTCGYDYVELSMVDLMVASDAQFVHIKQAITDNHISCLVCYLFFPWQLKIVGPETDEGYITQYIQTAVQRAASVGATKLVVGSGSSRLVPSGFNQEKALKQFGRILNEVQTAAAPEAIQTIIEPMCRAETNLINTVNEAFVLIAEMEPPLLKTMIDLYHFHKNEERYDELKHGETLISHIHLSNDARGFPSKREEIADLFQYLRSISYDGTVSIEASTSDFQSDARQTLSLLKTIIS